MKGLVQIASEQPFEMNTDVPFDFRFLERFLIPLKRFRAGNHVFVEGDAGHHMFVVLEGQVKIVRDGLILETVGLHGVFGEMALIDDSPRSATATTVTASELAIIDRAGFLRLVGENPGFSLYVMKQMGLRIRRLNETLRPETDAD